MDRIFPPTCLSGLMVVGILAADFTVLYPKNIWNVKGIFVLRTLVWFHIPSSYVNGITTPTFLTGLTVGGIPTADFNVLSQ